MPTLCISLWRPWVSAHGEQGPGGVPHPRGGRSCWPCFLARGIWAPLKGSCLSTVDGPPMQRSRHISFLPKPLTKMGFDEVSVQWTRLCPHVHPSVHGNAHHGLWLSLLSPILR